MKFSIISKEVVTAFKERNQIAIIAAIVAISNVFLVTFLFANKERVVLVPAQINTQMWTERKAVSKEYLEEMIEHHSMALLTSEEILQKTESERVKRLAENIIITQEKEIEYMKQLVNSI